MKNTQGKKGVAFKFAGYHSYFTDIIIYLIDC